MVNTDSKDRQGERGQDRVLGQLADALRLSSVLSLSG